MLAMVINRYGTAEDALLADRVAKPAIKADEEAPKTVKTLIESGKIKPMVDKVFPLSQLADGHDYAESGKAFGKVVIEIN